MLSVMDVWVTVGTTVTRDVVPFSGQAGLGTCDQQVWGQLLGQAASACQKLLLLVRSYFCLSEATSACQKLLLKISELGTEHP
jgi:hypothetical protein